MSLMTVLIVLAIIAVVVAVIFTQSRKTFREQKNYERGLKMIPLMIHLPPSTDDVESGSRDARDVTEETISQAQSMYQIISSTATKGFKSKFYGQRHLAFEIVAHGGLIHYFAVVPIVLLDTVKNAIATAYPTARLEEVEENNLFSETGKISGTIGGELTLKKDYSLPIATYQESKRDGMRAILNAMAGASRDDGVGVQILLRPAPSGWSHKISKAIKNLKKGKKGSGWDVGNLGKAIQDIMEALWKAPEAAEKEKAATGEKPLSELDQAKVEAMAEKAKHSGYETLIRVVASSNTAMRSQKMLNTLVGAFAQFNSPTNNSFKFTPTKNIEEFVTAYIFRFFPQTITSNVLNTVELATIFHLPDQSNIPSSQVQRQLTKQVDGPTEALEEGFLLGYNSFRGVKKPIRLNDTDRRRHMYIIGQTGTGKSVLLENLALQDMLDGKGFALVDPHGDLAETLLAMVPKERVEDVIYFNPGDMDNPMGMNLFEVDKDDPDPERTKDYLISETMNMLYSLYDPGRTGIVGPRMENIVRNAALLLMADPDGGTFMDIPKVLVDPEYAKSKMKYLTNQRAIDFWTKEWPNAQRSNDAGEVTSWVVSKWASFENAMMSNILGQVRSSLDMRAIMDQGKILLVNLSKGKMGELPSKLLGMVFVMKFQAAAMGRANIPEEQRRDFTLYVDEFQNFATDSFESILSEARKYRLSLIVANQFMTQLTDKIREAVIGNVGTVICGRIGSTDAELMVKRFQPTFTAEDLQKIPNYTSITSVLIHGTPSAPFTMDWVPPMGHPNPQLADAMQRLSSAKYGRDRTTVEREINERMTKADRLKEAEKQKRLEAMRNSSVPVPRGNPMMSGGRPMPGQIPPQMPPMRPAPGQPMRPMTTPPKPTGSSFLDEWLAKRQQIPSQPKSQPMAQRPMMPVSSAPKVNPFKPLTVDKKSTPQMSIKPPKPSKIKSQQPNPVVKTKSSVQPSTAQSQAIDETAIADQLARAKAQAEAESNEQQKLSQQQQTELTTRDDGIDEISIDLRGNIHYDEQKTPDKTSQPTQ